MATNKKKIEKRWVITRYGFDPRGEIRWVERTRTKPMTERKVRKLAVEECLGKNMCWEIRKAYK